MRPANSRFGKRGRVDIHPPSNGPQPSGPLGSTNNLWKWAGGGIAAVFLLGLIAGGTGGGGLLGGLIGGLLGHQLAKKMATPGTSAPTTSMPSSTAAAPHATPSTSVQRGGFGSTATSGSGFSSGS